MIHPTRSDLIRARHHATGVAVEKARIVAWLMANGLNEYAIRIHFDAHWEGERDGA